MEMVERSSASESSENQAQSSPDAKSMAFNINFLPHHADFLIANSTIPGFISFRRETGSWFIQTLCEVLKVVIPMTISQHIKSFSCDSVLMP